MPLSNDDFITLPKEWLREVLTNDPPSHIFGMRPISKVSSIDFTPRVIRIELGRLLAAKDSEGQHYKIFLYEDTRHAELWPRKEWEESLSKRLLAVSASVERVSSDMLACERRQAIGAWVQSHMGIDPESYAGKKLIGTLAKLSVMPVELSVFSGLEEVLTQYGNLNKST